MARTGRLLLAVIAATTLLSACGSASPADQVRSTLAGYGKAVAARDYQSICDTYLAPKLVDGVESNTGLPCEAAVRPEISSTEKPKLTVRSVAVHGNSASAQVHTTAANQAPSDDTVALVKVGGAWRIASLATAGPQPAGP